MVDVIKVKTGSKYEESGSYSRLVAVGDLIFVSNTAGIDYATRHIPDDAGAQCEKALQNVERALSAVGASLRDVVKIVRHIPNREDKEQVGEVIGRVFKGIDPASGFLLQPRAAHASRIRRQFGRGALPGRAITGCRT